MCCAQVQLLHQRGGGGVRLVAADLGQHQTDLTPQGHVLSGDESDFGRLWRSLPTPDLPFGCTRHSTLLMRQEPFCGLRRTQTHCARHRRHRHYPQDCSGIGPPSSPVATQPGRYAPLSVFSPLRPSWHRKLLPLLLLLLLCQCAVRSTRWVAVSYTHLTLPTILRV